MSFIENGFGTGEEASKKTGCTKKDRHRVRLSMKSRAVNISGHFPEDCSGKEEDEQPGSS